MWMRNETYKYMVLVVNSVAMTTGETGAEIRVGRRVGPVENRTQSVFGYICRPYSYRIVSLF